jgi:hypothetical protein
MHPREPRPDQAGFFLIELTSDTENGCPDQRSQMPDGLALKPHFVKEWAFPRLRLPVFVLRCGPKEVDLLSPAEDRTASQALGSLYRPRDHPERVLSTMRTMLSYASSAML